MVVLSEIVETCSSSVSINYHYDVFLSFRGINTRCNFTDHLHKALLDAAINTFFDDVEIQTGEDLKPELESAIKASRASIIVLSKDYASSTWCLDELVLILEQRRTSKHIVIPIFYHVKPTDVRKQQSSFGDAMTKHKQKMETEPNEQKKNQWAQKMKLWEEALTEVANMKGEEANGRRETILIEGIVKEISNRLEIHKRSKIPHLIGMESSVRTVTSFLKDGSSHSTGILTISGMAGIGKTYLANYIFKLHYLDFERSSFLEDIERRSKQPNALLDLQKQLLKDIRDITWMDIHDVNVGTSKIEKLLHRKRTLLVLDGIDHFEQLDVLIGKTHLHPGSRIIVTTKEASLTEKCRLFETEFAPKHKKHMLEGLNQKESLQLLSWHAFGGNYPKENYRNEATKVVNYCGGNPLALTVLGSSLLKEDVAAWEDTIELLQKETNPKIQQVLQISFDSLPSENDKELFKHIACFFVGKDREFTEAILRECGMNTKFGFSKLIGRCLITVGPRNKLMMHQLLQELGRDLVRQESIEKPWKRSRLWHHKESYDVLKQGKGTGKIQGLVLDMKMIENHTSHGTSSSTNEKTGYDLRKNFGASPLLQRVCDIFLWIWCLFAWVFLLRSSNRNMKHEIKTNAFCAMDKLRLLQLHYVRLQGSYEHFPGGLRWLSMHGFPLSYVPLDLKMENMVALDMSYSNLQHLWKKPKLLGSLKFLILRYCHELVSVGHFEGFPLLERLIVAGCVSLVEVCETIGNCVRLFLLDVSGCTKLKKLPRSIGKLKNLRTLLIDGCSNLGEFPVEMKDMKSLEVLTADNINMESRVSSSVIIPRSFKPFAISLPRSLVRLSLRNNNLSNESFHVDFGSLSMLVELDLSGNPIDSLPYCVRSLSRLEFLSLGGCRRLKTVLCAPSTLKHLITSSCESLEKITFQSQMSTQPYIEYEDRTLLTEIEGTFKMQTIAEVDEEILCRLGWINIQQRVKDQKLPMKNYISWAGFHQIPQVLPVQMLYESGIFSTFFQGSWFPDWLTYITTSSKLCFTLPSSDKKCKIRGLNLCVVTGVTSSTLRAPYPRVELRNLTKNYKWRYTPLRCVIPEPNIRSIVWLSHWVFENNEFEDGDEVVIQALVDLGNERAYKVFGLDQYYHQACGASVVYDDENKKEEDSLAYYKSWKRNIVDDETLRGGCVYFTDSLK